MAYSWARRVWTSISPHEKQSLLRSTTTLQRSSKTVYDKFVNGESIRLRNIRPVTLTRLQRLVLDEWSQSMKEKWDDMDKLAKENRWYGLEIPREWSGHGQTPFFHSQFLQRVVCLDQQGHWLHKLMVPNSLGPAQLLLKYGTTHQKEKYLGQLPSGDIIPCFALTGPWNGSDAGHIPDIGVIEEKDGVRGIRFSCHKRWSTLAPIAGLLSIAIRVKERGITLLLLEKSSEMMIRCHSPIGSNFPNGEIRMNNVWVPIETHVLGGEQGVGQGWKMLMNCLHEGRGISLPSVSLGGNSFLMYHSLYYTLTRQQFQTSLIDFYGVQRVLSDSICAWLWTRILNDFYHALLNDPTIDASHQSSALSAMMKWWCTELHRDVVQNTMEIFGGKGISLGPSNPCAHFYLQNPIGITVEGANLLSEHVIIPIQTLFEHVNGFSGIIHALETQNGAAFYTQVTKICRHLGQHLIQSLYSTSSRIVVHSYMCLLYGHHLRHRQDVCSAFTRHVTFGFSELALEWYMTHYPQLFSHKSTQTVLLRYLRHRLFSNQRRMLSFKDSRHMIDVLLTEPQVTQLLEQDLVFPVSSSPYQKVAELWKQWRRLSPDPPKSYSTFTSEHVPRSVIEQIIHADTTHKDV